jgi:nucleoside-diphosphate-sugar epimerase
MNSISITGYNGFIGKNLINALDKYGLVGVDLNNGHLVDEHIYWEEINNLKDVDCIIHLAGKAHDTENNKDLKEYYEVNVGLTQKIFQVFLHSKASKFIYLSSVAAVTDSLPAGDVLKEEATPNPLTHYGKSKFEAEKYIREQSLPKGKRVYILRPSMVHGPGNRGNLPLLFKFLQKGFPWPLGAYKNKRTFTYIGNLIFVIQQLLEKDIEPGTYQIVDDESVSTNDLVGIIMASLNKTVRILNIPPFLINLLAKVGDFIGLPINSFRLKKLTTSFEVSNKRIKNALGIEKMPYKAIEGLKMSINELTKDSN